MSSVADNKLREDEEFVIRTLAAFYSGVWRPGENPPDAYLNIGNEQISVEISTLTQHVNDEKGGSVPRLSKDATAIRVSEELNDELREKIPPRRFVLLVLRSPITKARKLKPILSNRILDLVKSDGVSEAEAEEEILGNQIKIHLIPNDRPSGKKVVGIVTNQKSSADILLNAKQILEGRIAVKAKKYQSLDFGGPLWLALFNDYWLADAQTYQQAIKESSVNHPFERILLVSGNKSVAILYEKHKSLHRPLAEGMR